MLTETTVAIVGIVVSVVAVVVSVYAVWKSDQANTRAQKLSQRQLIIPLAQAMQGLRDVVPDDLVYSDLISAVNAIELIAICWETKVIERKLIERVYQDTFKRLYINISLCKSPEGKNYDSGLTLLKASKPIQKFHKYLETKHTNQDKIPDL